MFRFLGKSLVLFGVLCWLAYGWDIVVALFCVFVAALFMSGALYLATCLVMGIVAHLEDRRVD